MFDRQEENNGRKKGYFGPKDAWIGGNLTTLCGVFGVYQQLYQIKWLF